MMLKRARDTWQSVPALILDAALALALGLLGALQLMGHGPAQSFERRFDDDGIRIPEIEQGGDTISYLLVAACAASLLPRSRYPWVSFVGVLVFGSIFLYRGDNPFAILLVVLVATYSAVASADLSRAESIGLAVTGLLTLGMMLYASGQRNDQSLWAMDAAWGAAAIFLGDSTRSRRAYIEEAELREAQAEVSHAEEARRRLSEDRLQIARDLHDVVAHNISLINVQAGVAAHLLDDSEQQAREAFTNIKQASHETLQELRTLVGVLREPAEGTQLTPTLGLAAMDQLVDAVREAGHSVDVKVVGDRRALPGAVDLSAYRILQEALTNAVKHAPGSRIDVTLTYGPELLAIELVNDLVAGKRAEAGGFGITGMRERAQSLGGRLQAGPVGGGRFRVIAELPLSSDEDRFDASGGLSQAASGDQGTRLQPVSLQDSEEHEVLPDSDGRPPAKSTSLEPEGTHSVNPTTGGR